MSQKVSGKPWNNIFLRDLNSLKIVEISFLFFFYSFLAPYWYRKFFESYRIFISEHIRNPKKKHNSTLLFRFFPLFSETTARWIDKHKHKASTKVKKRYRMQLNGTPARVSRTIWHYQWNMGTCTSIAVHGSHV